MTSGETYRREAAGARVRPGLRPLAAAVLAATLLSAAPLAAQHPAPGAPAATGDSIAAGITVELTRQLSVLAADSFRGRATPSAALERTARYLAGEFERLGLAPEGAYGQQPPQWIQRYPVPGGWRVDTAGTVIVLTVLDSALQATLARGDRQEVQAATDRGDTPADTAWLNRTAYFTMPLIPLQPRAVDGESWATIVVAGPLASDSLTAARLAARLADKAVLYVPPAELDSAAQARVVAQLAAATRFGVLVLAADDSASFAARRRAAQRRLPRVVEAELQNVLRPHGWVAHVWPGAVTRALAAAKLDLAALRAADTVVVRAVPAVKVDLRLSPTPPDSTWPTAPNVRGWLEGTDSARFVHWGRDSVRINEFVLIMAHMDEAGPSVGASAAAPASSNTLGVAGLLALAQAFSRPEVRPRRSVLLLATSGGATPEMWGAHYSLGDGNLSSRTSPMAAVLNLDRLERAVGDAAVGDSVWVDGLGEVERMPTIDWIAAAHPELGLTVVDGGTAYAPRSDHFGFAWRGRPLFYFHATPPAEARRPEPAAPRRGGDTASAAAAARPPAAEDVARAARIIRLVLHVATAAGNAEQLPRLNAAGRAQFMAAIDHLP